MYVWRELQLFQTVESARMAPLAGKGRECLPLKTLQEVLPPQASRIWHFSIYQWWTQVLDWVPQGSPGPSRSYSNPRLKTICWNNSVFRSIEKCLIFLHFEIFNQVSSLSSAWQPLWKAVVVFIARNTFAERKQKEAKVWKVSCFDDNNFTTPRYILYMFFWSSNSRFAMID